MGWRDRSGARPSMGGRLARWSAWALTVADDVDPVTNGSFLTALDELVDQPKLEIPDDGPANER